MDLNPQIHYDELGEGFLVWLQVNVITAIAIASPWIVYQLWQFVAAGLYPNERKYITRYSPLSIALLIPGMLFVYLLVLPWTIEFFLNFANDIPLPTKTVTTTQPHTPLLIPQLNGDPVTKVPDEMWIDSSTKQIKIFFEGSSARSDFQPEPARAGHQTVGIYRPRHRHAADVRAELSDAAGGAGAGADRNRRGGSAAIDAAVHLLRDRHPRFSDHTRRCDHGDDPADGAAGLVVRLGIWLARMQSRGLRLHSNRGLRFSWPRRWRCAKSRHV